MNISTTNGSKFTFPGTASQNAQVGVEKQMKRLDSNVSEIAHASVDSSGESGDLNKALVEQTQIVQAVAANVKALDVANQTVGSILDIKI